MNTNDINRALVIIGPELLELEQPSNTALIRRAEDLARTADAELHLYLLCAESHLGHDAIAAHAGAGSTDPIPRRDYTAALAELVEDLPDCCAGVTHEIVEDSEKTSAILRHIARVEPSLVMKQADNHRFFLGIAPHTDWELARRSPVSLWLINEQTSRVDRIVAAVSARPDEPADLTASADYEVLHAADTIGTAFEAEVYPVNAFEVPELAGSGGAASIPHTQQRLLRTRKLKRRKGILSALAGSFEIARNNLRVREGRPAAVISGVAKEVSADVIVLGRRSVSWLERLIGSVTLEPVMSRADADIFIACGDEPATVRASAARQALQDLASQELSLAA